MIPFFSIFLICFNVILDQDKEKKVKKTLMQNHGINVQKQKKQEVGDN